MNLTLPITLTLDDVEAFFTEGPKGLANFPTLKPGEKKIAILTAPTLLAWLLIAGLAALLFTIFHNDSSSADPDSLTRESAFTKYLPYGIMFALILTVFIFRYLFKRKRAKSTWDKSPDLQQPQTFHITPDGITITSPTAESRCTWAHFTHFYEGDKLLLLYNSSKAAHILPKRAFPTPADADAFAHYCRSQISTSPTAFPVIPN